ncbi:helix-turn-helix transcriptional regulator [Cohnella zeiphila]|uniref:Helix-turn-helix transcriptional regulator n=1 Tax=Cohnella zeiphila TaxID=2761120 RepID=A0A7X0VW93_9BACL|nr:helix-turn-helix transcriptional regulator [Cohnella zeiphila]MBB6732954.1 helix-turn-helix transcriptional regulator [Cohnella zeiphila]
MRKRGFFWRRRPCSGLFQIDNDDPEHFSRMFKKITGQSPVDYLTDLRIRQAQRLLRSSPLTIKEIATRVGIDDPSYPRSVGKDPPFPRLAKPSRGTAGACA